MTSSLYSSDSTVSSSSWWKEPAQEVVKTSHDFNAIKLVCQFVLDPTIAATILSTRQKAWLEAFLHTLCQYDTVEKPPYVSLLCTAKAIIARIRQRTLSHTLGWNGYWLFSAINSSEDITTIAEKLGCQIHVTFCAITFPDLVAWSCGYQDDFISNLLDTAFNFRNDLAHFVQQHDNLTNRLVLLQKALLLQHPLSYWIVSTAMSFDTSSNPSNTSSDPSEALRFVLDPIQQLFEMESSGILPLVQRLSILHTRFESKILQAAGVNWPQPLSTDFSFWESIQRDSPNDLAKLNTESVTGLYFEVSPADLLRGGEYMRNIARLWSDLSDDALASLATDRKLTAYFMDLARHFVSLRNLHSATAIGFALSKWGFQPRKPSRVWAIINPKDNFATCRKFMAEKPCLPLICPYIKELRQSGSAPDQLAKASQFVGYLERRQEVEVRQNARVEEKVVTEKIILHRNSFAYILSLPPRDLKRNTVMRGGLSREDLEQSDINAKRAKTDDDLGGIYPDLRFSTPYTSTPNPSLQTLAPQETNPQRLYKQVRKQAAAEFLVAFRERHANEIWAHTVQGNYRIFKEARQQIEVLLGTVYAPAIALEILSSLDRTQMVLLSCATIFTGQHFSALADYLKSGHWTEEEEANFSCKFTGFVPGSWRRSDVLDKWDKLVKDIDEAYLTRDHNKVH